MGWLDDMAVVIEGSFSARARRLRTPLATVSSKVSELERRLGAQHLMRSTRRLELTDAGSACVAAAQGSVDQSELSQRDAGG